MKENKKIVWFLGVILFCLWAAIGFQVFEATGGEASEKSTVIENSHKGISRAEDPFRYVSDVRDPFAFRREIPKEQKKKKQPVQVVKIEPPHFKLNGIVRDKERSTAILEGTNGITFFLVVGDTLSGVKVVGIDEKVVNYLYQKQKFSWKLPDD